MIGLTAFTMFVELAAGYYSGSLALTADGWHMGTHVGALGLSAVAYWFARTRKNDVAFTFGTGKVYALAAYTSAITLGFVAIWMVVEAIDRFRHPMQVRFEEALIVAVFGLVVNLGSMKLLSHGHHHGPSHGHHEAHHEGHSHAHDHDHNDHGHSHSAPSADHHRHDNDVNLRAAYMHVLADAMTSVLAIAALLLGRYLGLWFLDPLIAIVGAVVIGHWGIGLCRDSARLLLDASAHAIEEPRLKRVLEEDGVEIIDLHIWELEPGIRACVVSLTDSQARPVDYFRARLLQECAMRHLTVEVRTKPST